MLRFAVMLVMAWTLLAGPCALRIFVEAEHTCACGMAKPGECGCPDCARIEKQKREQATLPVLRSSCEDQDTLVTPALPRALAPALAEVGNVPRGERIHVMMPNVLRSQTERAPPVPPPRA